jgi:hypothetical protein
VTFVVELAKKEKQFLLGPKADTEKNPPVNGAGLSLSYLSKVLCSMPTAT